MARLFAMWTPLRLLRALRRQPQDEPAQHRERWHARVQRLSPSDDTPIEHRPFTPLGDATRWTPPSRPRLREVADRPSFSKLAPEDLERRRSESRSETPGPAAF